MDDRDVSLHTDGDCQVDAAGESNLGQRQKDRDEVGVPVFSSYPAGKILFNEDYIRMWKVFFNCTNSAYIAGSPNNSIAMAM